MVGKGKATMILLTAIDQHRIGEFLTIMTYRSILFQAFESVRCTPKFREICFPPTNDAKTKTDVIYYVSNNIDTPSLLSAWISEKQVSTTTMIFDDKKNP